MMIMMVMVMGLLRKGAAPAGANHLPDRLDCLRPVQSGQCGNADRGPGRPGRPRPTPTPSTVQMSRRDLPGPHAVCDRVPGVPAAPSRLRALLPGAELQTDVAVLQPRLLLSFVVGFAAQSVARSRYVAVIASAAPGREGRVVTHRGACRFGGGGGGWRPADGRGRRWPC